MKNTIVLILIFISLSSIAQNRNNIYADVGLPPFTYGFSGTWDRKVIKHLDMGFGTQAYAYDVTNSKVHTAIYADLRPYINRKHSLFFFIANVGVDLYHEDADHYNAAHTNALYSALGFGYGYKINKRDMAPYVSLKIAGDNYMQKTAAYNYTDPQGVTHHYAEGKSFFYDGELILSVGFKF